MEKSKSSGGRVEACCCRVNGKGPTAAATGAGEGSYHPPLQRSLQPLTGTTNRVARTYKSEYRPQQSGTLKIIEGVLRNHTIVECLLLPDEERLTTHTSTMLPDIVYF